MKVWQCEWWMAGLAALSLRSVAAAGVLCSSLESPPGALFLYPDAPTSAVFNGNSFMVRGEDATLMGQPGPAPSVFGISARTAENAQTIRDELANAQLDNVTGKGFVLSPLTPSIGVVDQPDAAAIDAFVEAVLAAPHIVITEAVLASGHTAGDIDAPLITYMTGQGAGVTLPPGGRLDGAGILVVDDGFVVQGTLTYAGLVIVRGPASMLGTATIFGSLWAHDTNLTATGSAIVQYSHEAMGLTAAVVGPACETPVCGDGARTGDEACDDGNTLDGDCCSATCQLEASGSACPDDGNVCTGEQCDGAGTCVHGPIDGPCDDGDACTDGDTCAAGACVGGAAVTCGACMRCDTTTGCVGAPATGCLVPLVPAKSKLTLRRTDVPSQSRLVWRWRAGQATSASDLASPGEEAWTLCLFGGPTGAELLSRSIVPPTGTCRDRDCWRVSERGLRYDDSLRTTGIAQVKVLAGSDGKASARVLGGGASLDLAPMPVELPVTVQLRTGDDLCWEASYPSSSVVQGPAGLHGRGGP